MLAPSAVLILAAFASPASGGTCDVVAEATLAMCTAAVGRAERAARDFFDERYCHDVAELAASYCRGHRPGEFPPPQFTGCLGAARLTVGCMENTCARRLRDEVLSPRRRNLEAECSRLVLAYGQSYLEAHCRPWW